MRALVVAPEPFFSPRGTPLSVYYRTLMLAELGVDAAERERLWNAAVAAYPPYEEYQAKTERVIPVFVAEPV